MYLLLSFPFLPELLDKAHLLRNLYGNTETSHDDWYCLVKQELEETCNSKDMYQVMTQSPYFSQNNIIAD